jgi:hypothetical protein
MSSGGSDDREALGVDLPEGGLTTDLVLRSPRADDPDDAEECCD